MTSWQNHLSALQALVTDVRGALHGAEDPVVAGFPSSVLALQHPTSPLSAGDADLGHRVLEELGRLTNELTAEQTRVARELGLHRRMSASRSPQATAVYIDSRG